MFAARVPPPTPPWLMASELETWTIAARELGSNFSFDHYMQARADECAHVLFNINGYFRL